ncbi:MAG: hypothetical protein C0489_09750 [Candidatus Accumulibacter sp.]|nr:hypothetical protein [Accumulibacter sp.]MBA4094358.1 hypothetical protein [Accumulibacter sp.]
MTSPRPSHFALLVTFCALGAFVLTFADANWLRHQRKDALLLKHELVARLGLTDLCLFTEARYTRHLSMADLHSASQDHPLGLEKFPSGALVSPPAHLTASHERLDRQTEIPD